MTPSIALLILLLRSGSAPAPGPDQTPPAASSAPSAQRALPAGVDRPVSWKLLPPNILYDQKRIWTLPARLAEGKDWLPVATILGTTAGLIALDPTEAHYFRNTSTFHSFNNVFSSNGTLGAVLATPAALYLAGLVRKDSKMEKTALLAAEALGDAEIVSTVIKDATNRIRPSTVPARGNFSDTFFEKPPSLSGNVSFPSGHAIAAFAIATVVARRYGNHRWVPYAAYGAAAVVGFSRLTLSAHFTSDVFVGSALGYLISRFTVLPAPH